MEEREEPLRKRRAASLSEQLTVGRNEASYWQSNQMEQRLSGPPPLAGSMGVRAGTNSHLHTDCRELPFLPAPPPRSPGVSGRRTVSRKSREACSPAPSLPHVVIVMCVRESPSGEDSSAKCACCRFGVVKRGAFVIIPPRVVGAHPRAPPRTPAHPHCRGPGWRLRAVAPKAREASGVRFRTTALALRSNLNDRPTGIFSELERVFKTWQKLR